MLGRKYAAQVSACANNQILDALQRPADRSLICQKTEPSRAKPRGGRLEQNFAPQAKLIEFRGSILADHLISPASNSFDPEFLDVSITD